MFEVEKSMAQAQEKFNEMVRYVRQEGESEDAYRAEVRLFRDVLALGRCLLAGWFRQKGAGDVGEAILKTRAVVLNGDWDRFWHFHMQCDAARRFGAPRWRPATRSQAQKPAA